MACASKVQNLVLLVLHSSGHLLLSLGNPSNTLDQYTVTIDDLNYSSGVVNSDQKRDEQTMDSLQPRDQVVDKRAAPDEESAADSSMVRCRSDHPGEFIMIRMKRLQSNGKTVSTIGTHVETISVQSSPTESPVVRVSNDVPSPPEETARYRRHVNVTPTEPHGALLSCIHISHQLLPGANAASEYLTCLECRHHAKWTQ